MLSNDNFFALLPVAVDMWGFGADAVNLVAMPLFHIGGGGWAVAGMYEGATQRHRARPRPRRARAADPGRGHHPRLPRARPCCSSCSWCPGVDRRRLLVAGDDRLRRLADQRGGAGPQHRHVRRPLLAGLRADRDDRRRRQPAPPRTTTSRGPNRHRLRSCGVAGPGVELRIVDPETGDRRADRRRRRDLDPVAAGDEGLLEQRRGDRGEPSTPTAGSAPATSATSTTTATSTSTTGSRT